MRHPDEGTIHAWLDGALSAEEGRAIEEHVARCEPCAAMVADARGLVAGASRILTGLDYVPGGVIPGAAAASARAAASAAAAAGSFATGRPRGASWTRSPALRAAVVVLFLGGATVAVMRQWSGTGEAVLDRQQSVELDRASQDVAESAANAAAESATPPAPPAAPPADVAGAGRGAAAPQSVSRAESEGAPAKEAPRRETDLSSPQAAAPERREAPAGGFLGGVAGAPAAATGVRADSLGISARTPAPGVLSARVAQGRARQVPPAADTAARARIAAEAPRIVINQDSLRRQGRAQAQAFSAPTAEEQRLRDSASQRLQLSEIVVTGVAAPAPVDLAGCYTITLAPWIPAGERGARSPSLPPLLVLESIMVDLPREGPLMALRAAGDTAAPSSGGSYWRVAGRDSVLLVWRATSPETTIRLGGAGRIRTGVAEHDGRRASVTAERVGARCGVERDRTPPPAPSR